MQPLSAKRACSLFGTLALVNRGASQLQSTSGRTTVNRGQGSVWVFSIWKNVRPKIKPKTIVRSRLDRSSAFARVFMMTSTVHKRSSATDNQSTTALTTIKARTPWLPQSLSSQGRLTLRHLHQLQTPVRAAVAIRAFRNGLRKYKSLTG